ncbi:hypothetical protein HYV84_05325 [Candidatus Woesearchaeota archaeon]|nr:hypothetical protein [Candidatus Woesearchaeota archaeon]
MKRRLTPSEEFEIMKIVLDKFLWLGVVIMIFGLYNIFIGAALSSGITLIIVGAILLILFLLIIIKEYEIIR